ncbi:Hypothetical protein CINCED_3A001343 [Cinara cedri]|uniref:Uncharacterized protein n=1 Tax=Cinara cedri TaxID=506608 RepID=A0A5E4ME22_9HEMI|nr:Hypothetical protein CINCED_3A001343 [Cinara cedri]
MTEAVVTGKDTRCLFINNGDDLLTLKKVVSKKSDKDDCEKQKNKKSKEINGSELNGTLNKTDSINFDIDNTSSLEPNLEMDSDTDRNITIDSICTQEDRESENIDNSNENSNEADVKIGEKDIQEISIKGSDIPYSPSDSIDDNEYSHDLVDDDLDNIKSPASYFNISSRAPLHSNNELDNTLEDEISTLEEEIISSAKKRKFEDLSEEQNPSKVLKLWNYMKFPFQKITIGTSMYTNKSNTTEATKKIINKVKESSVPVITLCENDSEILESEEINKLNNTETEPEIESSFENIKNKQTFCSLM